MNKDKFKLHEVIYLRNQSLPKLKFPQHNAKRLPWSYLNSFSELFLLSREMKQ